MPRLLIEDVVAVRVSNAIVHPAASITPESIA